MELDLIRKRLAIHQLLRNQPVRNGPQGAVAAILRPQDNDTEILLIKRAERLGDPWSGHMALPGGHMEPQDLDSYATAIRETKEEIGTDLEITGELIGRLDDLNIFAHKHSGMTIIPYVFILHKDPKLNPNEEVAEVLWGPLGKMKSGKVNTTKEYRIGESVFQSPGYDIQGRIIWGLTYRILQNLFSKLSLENGA